MNSFSPSPSLSNTHTHTHTHTHRHTQTDTHTCTLTNSVSQSHIRRTHTREQDSALCPWPRVWYYVAIRGGVVCQGVWETEGILAGKIDHSYVVCVCVSVPLCVCVYGGERHMDCPPPRRELIQSIHHTSVCHFPEGRAGEAGGSAKWEMDADTDTDTGNPSAVEPHHSPHPASLMESRARDSVHVL